MGEVLFSARDVRCTVPSSQADAADKVLFDGLDVDVHAGEIIDLVGPSGSGKSSLLTAFALLNAHASGTFALEGRDSVEFTPQQWRREVAYLPQKASLTGDTVADAIRLPWGFAVRADATTKQPLAQRVKQRLSGKDTSALALTDETIRTTLDSMGCSDIELTRPPHDLSGGQAARVSLARTLLTHPKVLLADEVDAGLDDENAEKVADIMAQAASRGMAVIRIRHRASDGRATRTLTLKDGVLSETSSESTSNEGEVK